MDKITKSIQRQMKQQLLIIGCLLVAFMGFTQKSETKVADNLIYDGNELHKSETYAQAEKKYRKALARTPKNTIAQHNLGNTLFDESYYGEAFNAYKSAAMSAQSKAEKHSALHNMGNVFMNQKDYAKAVESYKEALRNNPKDDQTRYNYALAKEMLENENQNQDQENQDNQDQQNKDQQNQDNKDSDDQSPKDDSKDNKDQDQGGENKDQQDQSDKDKNPQNEQQDPKAQPTKLSPQQIKNLLEAMNNEEKKVQDKVNAKKAKTVKPKSKKDW